MARKPTEESKPSEAPAPVAQTERAARRPDPRLVALARNQPKRRPTTAGEQMAKTAVRGHKAPVSRVSERMSRRGDTRTAEDVKHAEDAYKKNPNMMTLAVLSNVRKLAG